MQPATGTGRPTRDLLSLRKGQTLRVASPRPTGAGLPVVPTSRRHTARRYLRATLAPVVAGAVLALGMPPVQVAAAEDWRVVAHRGGNVWGPENTLASFRHAVEIGADAVELDVQFTRDGIAVVLHDERLDRTTECTGAVRNKRWAKVRTCAADVTFGARFGAERVPALSNAIKSIVAQSTDVAVYINVKDPSRREARRIMEIVRKRGLTQDRLVVTGQPAWLATMKKAGAKTLAHQFNSEKGWATDFPILIPFGVKVTRELVEAAHLRGQVVLPHEGRPHKIARLQALGVDGVLANDLDAAVAAS